MAGLWSFSGRHRILHLTGIRMVTEWFPANEIGLAEGIYGGWGNFGSAGAASTLPTILVKSHLLNSSF